jgi:hypothetical protein
MASLSVHVGKLAEGVLSGKYPKSSHVFWCSCETDSGYVQ